MVDSINRFLIRPLEEPIDERRYERHATFVPSDLLTERLSPQGYRPEILLARKDLAERHRCRPLQSLCKSKIRQGTTPIYGDDGPTCLKPQNIRPLLIEAEVDSRVSATFASDNPSLAISDGAVLINRSGAVTLGRTGVYLRMERVFISEHVFACYPKPVVDAGFLAAYLNSWWGKRSLESGIAGSTGQLQLPQSHIASLPIPEIAQEIQRSIGNKVRKAQRLREMSLTARSEVREQLDRFVAIGEPVPERSSWTPSQLIYPRIDARPYGPHYLGVEKAVRRLPHDSIRKVASIRGGDPVSSDFFGKSGIGLVRIRDIGPNGFEKPDIFIPESYCATRPGYAATKGLVVVGMDGEFRAQFFLENELPRLINQRIAMITTRDIRPELLCEWLNRPVGQIQLYRWSVKTTVEHISLDDIREVLIPRMGFDTEEHLSNRLYKARHDHISAEVLLDEVKKDVESVLMGCFDRIRLEKDGDAASVWLEANPSIANPPGEQ